MQSIVLVYIILALVIVVFGSSISILLPVLSRNQVMIKRGYCGCEGKGMGRER